jgi:mannan endo-1,4-beta-mannosidase
MNWLPAAAAAALLLCSGSASPAGPADPVNPNASPEARALLRYLHSISGRYTLSGQHNFPNTIARWTDRAYDFAGKYPAVFGQDFGFQGGDDKDSILARPALIAEVKRQYRNGAIVTLTWHAVRPTDDEPVSFRESVQGKLSDFEWSELLRPGSRLYERWCVQVDVIAGYLRQLQDARIPVLWRPYHEVNGGWFWWGGRKGKDGSAALYRQLFDRFVKVHKLDNLVWVWNANAPGPPSGGPGPYADFFPGSQYADVLSSDIYGEFTPSHYAGLLEVAAGKPIALGEVGALPSLAVLKEQPKWTWFMTWSEFVEVANPIETVIEVYNAPNILNRDDPRVAGPMAAIRKASAEPAPEPVTPRATAEARALLARLSAAAGRRTLSGQDNDPQAVSRATGRVFEITSKYPSIYGQDLGVSDTAPILEEARRQHRDRALVSLSWHPRRPTDEGAGKLTDFEWNEMLTPGARLNQRWSAQVDAVAESLKKLQTAGIAVLWRPYPRPNATEFWWAGRKGVQGSATLYRMLFERLVSQHGLRNLIWVWTAAAPGFRPDSPGPYDDFFPGLGYVDAVAVDLEDAGSYRWRPDSQVALFGVGKAVGLGIAGRMPASGVLGPQSQWAWFMAGPGEPDPEALRNLYNDPRVETR